MQELQDGSAKQSTALDTNQVNAISSGAPNQETTSEQIQDALEVLEHYDGRTP